MYVLLTFIGRLSLDLQIRFRVVVKGVYTRVLFTCFEYLDYLYSKVGFTFHEREDLRFSYVWINDTHTGERNPNVRINDNRT